MDDSQQHGGLANSLGLHVLERNGEYLLINPEKFTWVRTSETGKEVIRGLTGGTTCESVAHQLDVSTEEVIQFRDYLEDEEILPAPASPYGVSRARLDTFSRQSRPTGCAILLTNRCNLACKHCFYASGPAFQKAGELSTGQFMAVLDQLVAANVQYVAFTGGEPLVRDDIWQLIDYASDRGLDVILPTNGLLIDAEAAELLAKRKVQVQISLDGASPSTNNLIRGHGFRRVIQHIGLLVREGCDVTISIVPMKENLAEIPDLIRLMTTLGIRKYNFSLLEKSGRGKQIYDASRPSDWALAELFKQLYEDYYEKPGNTLNLMLLNVMMERLLYPPNRSSCRVGREVIAINYDGGLYPCSGLVEQEHRIGSVLSANLGSLYHSQRMQRIRRKTVVQNIQRCRTCPFILPCQGGCRSKAYVADRRLDTPDPYCSFLREMFTFLLWKMSDSQTADRWRETLFA